ncbi:radical SAM/SPASM domain-containing protein [Methanosalsum natronophilum]|uniref:radical SAM/SPASM domain-containing protein n=1 Tax=Methanosalsum natronophilum TaxID=768733 RepID=UPI0021686770|nr:radical SAM/SPASM domain-containing protein [Methanosalsum natronophilum]MCS3923595.1 MoaA/NifB/PqqE/SkfB family radical SAM enzyme [Methanosalsum natronophilum]
MNKNLSSYIKKLKERDISSCIITNGVLLTPEKQKDLIESGLDQIQISYLTTNKNRYSEIVGNKGNFETLNCNLQHLFEIRPSGLRVRLNFLDTDFNTRDFHKVKEIADNWGFDTFYRREHSRGGSNLKLGYYHDSFDSCLRCGTFPSVHFITTDGNVVPCCNDTRAENILGNITYFDYESVVKNKLKVMLDKYELNICKNCTDDYRWYTLLKVK